MSNNCTICKKYTGLLVIHSAGGCPLASSTLCRRCHHRGHLTSECTSAFPHWERPMSLEELIPLDVRQRYNITTHTTIDWKSERSEETMHEIAPINEITLPYNYTAYKDFIEKRKIRVEKVTKESLSACHKAVKAWCVANGYRLVRQDDIQYIAQQPAQAVADVTEDVTTDRDNVPQNTIA